MNKEKIRKLRDRGLTYRTIGKVFGVSPQRIGQIITRAKYGFKGLEFTREKARKRDNWTCQICGKRWKKGTRRLDVHHLDCDKSKSLKYDNVSEINNMITLCHKCHLNIPEHRASMVNGRRLSTD